MINPALFICHNQFQICSIQIVQYWNYAVQWFSLFVAFSILLWDQTLSSWIMFIVWTFLSWHGFIGEEKDLVVLNILQCSPIIRSQILSKIFTIWLDTGCLLWVIQVYFLFQPFSLFTNKCVPTGLWHCCISFVSNLAEQQLSRPQFWTIAFVTDSGPWESGKEFLWCPIYIQYIQ